MHKKRYIYRIIVCFAFICCLFGGQASWGRAPTAAITGYSSNPQLTSISPNASFEHYIVAFSGNHFSHVVDYNRVYFTGSSGPIEATITASNPNQIQVIVPTGVKTGPAWVEVITDIDIQKSNTLIFTRLPEHNYSFGFGGDSSDRIVLYADGEFVARKSNGQSQSSATVPLAPGPHTLQLRGEQIFGVGRYFLSLPSGINSNSGDALTGNGLGTDVHNWKTFYIYAP